MGCGNRNTGKAGIQQAKRRRKVCGEALIFFKLYHVHTNGFNDFFTADTGAESHYNATQKHQPYGDYSAFHAALATAEGNAQKQDANEFLSILRAVHEAHGSSTEYLCALEEAVGFTPVHFPADQSYKPADNPSGNPSEGKAEYQSVQNLLPFFHINAADTALNGDCSAGQAGDQAVAFTGGNAEIRGSHAVDYDGKQRCAQGDQGF